MVFAWVLILFNPKFFLFELKKQNLENFDIFSTAEPWKSKVMNLCTNLTYDTNEYWARSDQRREWELTDFYALK